MGRTTGIEWTDSTWNPIRGCSRVSEGCRNCYAEAVAARFSGSGQPYDGLASFRVIGAGKPEERVEPAWTGKVRLIEQRLDDPLHWREPRKIFVNSMSDLFHEGVDSDWIARIFEVMKNAPQHTYQILTKRPERMLAVLTAAAFRQSWPPQNWWFGVSIEDQETANERLPILARCEAAVHFVSYEPALGPVDWFETDFADLIDWLIVGGESGPHARPMHPDWARAARRFCEFHGIAFFFKQWGAFIPGSAAHGFSQWPDLSDTVLMPEHPGRQGFDSHQIMNRVGKHLAGAVLDGCEHKEFPACR
jgi:protein gp37